MPNYVYPDDGKIHTRYTELSMCTQNQIDRVVAIRNGDIDPFYSPHMAFGTERHNMFEEESRRTGHIPSSFNELKEVRNAPLDLIEAEWALEIVPGMVVHSRPDGVSVSRQTIFDYKTTVDGKNGWRASVRAYRYSKQAKFYAMVARYHGIEIIRANYLCEIWSADREHILGYELVEQKITQDDLREVRAWAISRLALLKVAINQAILAGKTQAAITA